MSKHPLISANNKLLTEWDFSKNSLLDPNKITQGSPQKVWWKCSTCGHEWQARINSRLKSGCSICKGLGVLKTKNILCNRSDIKKYFDEEKNPGINPQKISTKSKLIINLKCRDCGSKWTQPAYQKADCKICAHEKLANNSSLQALYPEISSEWDYDKNKPLLPSEISSQSKRKNWWICSKGHHYIASIRSRTLSSTGCPVCRGRKSDENNSLGILYPNLLREWDYSKNSVDPNSINPRSNKKVSWVCRQGHHWIRQINYRTQNDQGCPFCSYLIADETNNLEITHPNLLKEWDENKNTQPISNFTHKSSKYAWWKCQNGHHWKAIINTRCNGAQCSYCIGKLASETSNLATDFPDVASEWHPTKNLGLSPQEFRPKSSKKVWWLCKRGHEYYSTISSRANGSGCPTCSPSTSKAEIRTYSELKSIFPDAEWQEKIDKTEIDVYIPSIKLGFEIDGYIWHKDKTEKDTKKVEKLKEHGITIVRMRDELLPSIGGYEFFFNTGNLTESKWFEFINYLTPLFAEKKVLNLINQYLNDKKFIGTELYADITKRLPAPPKENSLATKFPKLSLEWDLTKNYPLTPDLFTAGSNEKVWWKCSHNHNWKSSISTRTRGINCPYCSKTQRLITKTNSLSALYPNIAKEWNSPKNENINPESILGGTHKKYWWKCTHGHEWEATVASRTKNNRGCPYCKGSRVNNENSFLANYSDIAKEWDGEKNDRKPSDVTKKSEYKAWWKCSTCGHEWQAKVYSRAQGKGCIKCSYKNRFKKGTREQ